MYGIVIPNLKPEADMAKTKKLPNPETTDIEEKSKAGL